jgi:hypothetical protein
MTALDTLYGAGPWYLLCLVSLSLLIWAQIALIRTLREKRGKWLALLSLAAALLAFVLFIILMDYGHSLSSEHYYAPFQRMLFALPWLLYFGTELLLGALLLCAEREYRRHRKTHLTADAIRQTVNLLPEGIAISDSLGTVRLANLKMESLCRTLTGEVLSDAERFLKKLHKQSVGLGGQLLVKTDAGEVWLFEEESITVDEEPYRQLTARDVTELYLIIEELKEKNVRLLDIQRRMRAASDLSGDMFVAEEQAKARAALHNQLGQVLLMGQHYISRPENTDPKLVYTVTRQMNRFLLGEAEEPYAEGQDALAEAVSMAKSIGVAVHLNGDMPQEAHIREIIAQAIIECAANTVKHAEGDSVSAELVGGEDGFRAVITNSGRPPKRPVAESGGLLSLRRKTEAAGGTMHVESSPAFVLTLYIPSRLPE